MLHVSDADRDTLRRLAERYRSICESAHVRWCVTQWRSMLDLRGSERPLVCCQPEGATAECLPDSEFTCDPGLRGLERLLRYRIRMAELLADDTPWMPLIEVPWRISHDGWGVDIPEHQGDGRGSKVWDPPITDIARDLPKLHHRRFAVDRAASDEELARIQALVGDILPVRRRYLGWWTLGMTVEIIRLVGLQPFMTLMYDDPDGLHAVMAFMRDDHLGMLDFFEREGLLTATHDNSINVGSGGYGLTSDLRPADPDGPQRCADCWGFLESQETVGVSPRMFQQFVLPYQEPIMRRFGRLYYGCCEGLEKRLPMLMQAAPNLRVVSMSPWADQEAMARISDGRLVLARKPNPTLVCSPVFDEKAITADIEKTIDSAGHRPLYFMLKDTHTVHGEPWRLARWVALARAAVEARRPAAA
jgi:hypothetical protein